MLNLYLADLYKMRKSLTLKVVFIISAVCAVSVVIMAYMISQGKLSRNLLGINFLLSDVSMTSILGAVIAGVFICGDFDNRSIHEAIANGNSRFTVLISKAASFFTAVLAVLLPYAIVTGVALCTSGKYNIGSASMGFIYLLTSESGKVFSAAEVCKLLIIMVTLIVVYIGQLSLCVLFATAFKKPVVVVALNYVLAILVGQLQSLKGTSKIFSKVFACTPFGGDYGLANLSTSAGNIVKAVVVSLIFTAAALAVSYAAFRRSDIK